jgi:hypothetical protein
VCGKDEMKGILHKFTPIFATLSIKLTCAFLDQVVEIIKGIYRMVIKLWRIYLGLELKLLWFIVDFSLTMIAMRAFILLMLIGGILFHLGWWIWFSIYVLFLAIAALRTAKVDKDQMEKDNQIHQKSCRYWADLMRLPFRVVVVTSTLIFSCCLCYWLFLYLGK